MSQPQYPREPDRPAEYTAGNDRYYTLLARPYDLLVKMLPTWRNWLKKALPYLQGPRILEVSFGTGYLLTQYANRYRVWGAEYNRTMIETTRRNLASQHLHVDIQQADVNYLPYASESFDLVLNTMAFTGYPNGIRAMHELLRVLRPGGRLVILDINFPSDRNWLGMGLARFWHLAGDILRDMDSLFQSAGVPYQEFEVGGVGSVHLYVAEKV